MTRSRRSTTWSTALLLALVRFAGASEPSETEWTQVVERGGVVVKIRPGVAGEPVQSRATTQIDATVFEILAVLQDDSKRVDWMARCVEARELEKRSQWNRLSYTRLSVWPFADRDVVVETLVTLGEGAKSAEVRMRHVESKLQAAVDGVVRMPSMLSDFHLVENDRGTLVDFTLAMNLGGRVPPTLARYARQMIPLESLENLRRIARSSRDTYAELIATWESELEEP